MKPAVTLLSLCSFGVLEMVGVAGGAGGLIANPGFEQVDAESGFAAFWTPTYWSNPRGEITLVPEARTGARSVRITGVALDTITDATPRNNHLVAQVLEPPVTGFRKLTLEVWCKAAPDARAYCSIMTRNAAGERLQYISSIRHSNVTEWTRIILPISTDPATAQVTVYLRNEGQGPAWFDDVSLTASDDVLENELLRAHIEPLVGGRLRSLIIKRRDRDATLWRGVRPGGLAADIVPGDRYPGLLRDAACQVEVLEVSRRVRVTHEPLTGPHDGLVLGKEYSLRGELPVVEVNLTVTNTSVETRSIALRTQQCLPPRSGTITVPMAGQLRVLRHQEGLAKWGLDINDLDAGWIACADTDSDDAVLLLFDRAEVTKAYLYRNQDLQTVEWYYREVSIPGGGVWQTRYSIAVLHSGHPVVAVAEGIAVGLSPVSLSADADRVLTVSSWGDGHSASVMATAIAEPAVEAIEREVALAPEAPAAVHLPWQGRQVTEIKARVRAGESTAEVELSQLLLDTSPLMDLPPPPERLDEFPAATNFFPYGEYFRGYVQAAGGDSMAHVRRQLRAYRRGYINTYMSGHRGMLSNFSKTGEVPMLEEVRKRRMRIIPREELLRRFERDGNRRILRELPPEPATREAIVARLEQGGHSLDVHRAFAKAYADLLLAYDFSDEPQGQYIPNYMMLQSVYREVDPDHPVLVILNLNRTEFLPFMPIYYGDEYPIRNPRRGGRNPWAVTKMVRFCATNTKAPVWVMLQAFGGLEDYPWQLPNEAEMRLTIYETVANGGKGITFHGTSSPPCWRYNMHYFETVRDSWGVETPAWAAMREAGRTLTAIGPCLLRTEVTDTAVLSVVCENIGDDATPYRGPAIKASILHQREADAWFAVVVNQDIELGRQATLALNGATVPEGHGLYDLYKLSGTNLVGAGGHALDLNPGDGRIFFVGTKEAAEQVLADVHRGHYDNELPLYEMDLEVALANDCSVTEAATLAETAAKAAAAGRSAEAHTGIVAARNALEQSMVQNVALADAQQGLSDALALLSEVVLTYRRHFDVVVPPELRERVARNAIWNNAQDPTMQRYADATAEALCLRMELQDQIWAGETEQALPQIERLRETAVHLQAEAIPYVLLRAEAAAGNTGQP